MKAPRLNSKAYVFKWINGAGLCISKEKVIAKGNNIFVTEDAEIFYNENYYKTLKDIKASMKIEDWTYWKHFPDEHWELVCKYNWYNIKNKGENKNEKK